MIEGGSFTSVSPKARRKPSSRAKRRCERRFFAGAVSHSMETCKIARNIVPPAKDFSNCAPALGIGIQRRSVWRRGLPFSREQGGALAQNSIHRRFKCWVI